MYRRKDINPQVPRKRNRSAESRYTNTGTSSASIFMTSINLTDGDEIYTNMIGMYSFIIENAIIKEIANINLSDFFMSSRSVCYSELPAIL